MEVKDEVDHAVFEKNRALSAELEGIRSVLVEREKSHKLVADEVETLRNELSVVNAKLNHARHLGEATQRLSCIHGQLQKQLPSRSPGLSSHGEQDPRQSKMPDLGDPLSNFHPPPPPR
jgi:chromosome segregation ATPase